MSVAEKLMFECLDDALRGDQQSLALRVNQLVNDLKKENPDFAHRLSRLLQNKPQLRKKYSDNHIASPVDSDSRKNLLVEETIPLGDNEPILGSHTRQMLQQVIEERNNANKLLSHGLNPIRSILFYGDPGLGKTMSARWLAARLDLPLLTLDLATVMSSYLGKTGNNIKAIFDYAKEFPCILLLDEFDSIAKKRDDDSEVGELKRLVTVLLQEIDNWPASSLLVAATNHEELLDPAAWRRFDQIVRFDYPSEEEIRSFLQVLSIEDVNKDVVINHLEGKSFSDIESIISNIKKHSVIKNTSFMESFFTTVSIDLTNASKLEKKLYAKVLYNQGKSQREISEKTGLARQTVNKVVTGE